MEGVENIKTVNVEYVSNYIYNSKVGLIAGPDLTLGNNSMNNVCNELLLKYQINPKVFPKTKNPWELIEYFEEEDKKTIGDDLYRIVRDCSNKSISDSLLKVYWSGILDFNPNTNIKNSVQEVLLTKPKPKNLVIIQGEINHLRYNEVPWIPVLGYIENHSFVIDKEEYEQQFYNLISPVNTFVDSVQDHAFCFGFDSCFWLLKDLLRVLNSNSVVKLKQIVVVTTNPNALKEIVSKLKLKMRIILIVAPMGPVLQRLNERMPQTSLWGIDTEIHSSLESSDFVEVLNLKREFKTSETASILDSLFRPSSLRMDAFIDNMDFERDCLEQLTQEMSQEHNKHIIVVSGVAGVGKTTLVKRVACNLLKADHIVIWQKKYPYNDLKDQIKTVAKKFKKMNTSGPLIWIVDDPNFLNVDLQNFIGTIIEQDIDIKVVLLMRNMDYVTSGFSKIQSKISTTECKISQMIINDYLGDDECDRFIQYTKKFGVPSNNVASFIEKNKRDASSVMCLMYFFVQGSKTTIKESVLDEFTRLDQPNVNAKAFLAKTVVGKIESISTNKFTSTLRVAYELIATCDHFNTPVPIEVIVRALNIDDYGLWAKMLQENSNEGPGLFYEDVIDGSVYYRVRNSVVKDIIIEHINGNIELNKSIDYLHRAINCFNNDSGVVYGFISNLLNNLNVKGLNRSKIRNLFLTAINKAGWHQTKQFLHRYALWLKDIGEHSESMEMCEESLRSDNHPSSKKHETDEFISTTLISNLKYIHANQDLKAAEVVKLFDKHYRNTQPSHFQNVHAVHTSAEIMLSLAKDESVHGNDKFLMYQQSLESLQRSIEWLNNIKSKGRYKSELDYLNQIEMLTRLQSKVLVHLGDEPKDRESIVKYWFENETQSIFAAYIESRLPDLVENEINIGKIAKPIYDDIQFFLSLIEGPVSDNFARSIARFLYYWQVKPRYKEVNHSKPYDIDWALISTMSSVAQNGSYEFNNIQMKYLYALSLYHLNKYSQGKVMIQQISAEREKKWQSASDYFLGSQGQLKKYQGSVKKLRGASYFYINELDLEIKCDKFQRRWEAVDHAYIQFNTHGIYAVKQIK